MTLINYLTPPLVGAFIGYITNAIAIRMLFRPLRPWRVFGIRVPMTPGVIPGKRHEFAANIGRMVGAHLLSSADIAKAMSEEAFKRELEGMISSRVEALLHREMGPLPSVIPKRFQTSFEAGVNILRWRALKLIHSYLDSAEFSSGLGNTISSHVATFLARPLDSWLPGEHREHLFAVLSTALGKMLASPQAETWLRGFLEQRLDSIIEERKSLQDLLPKEIIDLILRLLENETPGLLAKAAQYAGEAGIRTKMGKIISGAIGNFIAGLGPMAAFATSFLTADMIEVKINEYLVDKADEIAAWFNNDQTKVRACAVLKEKVGGFLSRPISDILSDLPPASLGKIKDGIIGQLLGLMQSPRTCEGLSILLCDTVAAQTGRTSQEIMAYLFGGNGGETVKNWAVTEILAIIRSAKSKRILDELFGTLIEKNILRPSMGAMAKLLPKDVQSGIYEYLLQQSHTLLLEEVPRLVDCVNIQKIVTRKVDSLDLLRLENLLLGIMEEQFKYINLFGGLLGFILGLFNLLMLP